MMWNNFFFNEEKKNQSLKEVRKAFYVEKTNIAPAESWSEDVQEKKTNQGGMHSDQSFIYVAVRIVWYLQHLG